MHIVLLSIAIFIAAASPVYAYSDPGSGLLIYQLIGSALVGSVFYATKFKKWVLSKFSKKNKINDQE